MAVAFAFFLSSPSRRLRYAFMTSNVFLWMAGAWLYLVIPSLGPAYRFPEVWLPYSPWFTLSHHFQVILFINYMSVVKLARGANLPVIVTFGVAAFPSLHVGFQMTVGGGDDANVRLTRRRFTDALELLLLKKAQQLGL